MFGAWLLHGSEAMMFEIHFDGACEPKNPGGIATCGWVIYHEGGLKRKRIASGHKVVKEGEGATNNYAEWCALGLALRWLLDNKKDECAAQSIVIIGDSQLVINQLAGKWECKAENLQPLKARCLEILDSLNFQARSARWVPREQNEEADALSKKAYTERTGQQAPERRKKKKA